MICEKKGGRYHAMTLRDVIIVESSFCIRRSARLTWMNVTRGQYKSQYTKSVHIVSRWTMKARQP